MLTRRILIAAAAAVMLPGAHASLAQAQDKLPVIATFSILADIVSNVGGDRVEVKSLVGPNGDAHVYSPSPADAKSLADAKVVVTNGLGFEGWLARLIKSSNTKAPNVVATKGVKPRKLAGKHSHDHGHNHGHADGDPHAWQSVANVKIYVANIRDGLIKADPAGKATYEANAAAYLAKLDALDSEVKETISKIPPERRKSSPPMTPSGISRMPMAWNSSRRRECPPIRRPRPGTWRASSRRSKSRKSRQSLWKTLAMRGC